MRLAAASPHAELVEATRCLRSRRLPEAERIVRDVLRQDPGDVVAIRLLAEVGLQVGKIDEAIQLYERCLELAPGFALARQNYAVALSRRQRFDEALAQAQVLLDAEPANPNYRLLRGSLLVQKGEHREALALYEKFLAEFPRQAGAQLNYGHTLKTVGRLDESIAAYRTSIALRPATGEAYWSLANLKTFRFSDDDIRNMQAELDEDGDPDDQSHLLFALGKAMEDRERFDESFGYYASGQCHSRPAPAVQREDQRVRHRAPDQGAGRALLPGTPRLGLPCPGPDLHRRPAARRLDAARADSREPFSRVEGTTELPNIIAIARKLGRKSPANPASKYPEILGSLTEDEVARLGAGYLDSTRVHRHGRPFFIDKMPNNFKHVGLIHLILPNAKIIDARRHPMAGCFSCFKQLFAHGQRYTYSLTDLGHYYRDYVRLMEHWDTVLPGRVLKVQYEDMVADSETQIRRVLAWCGLEFEENCLRFYETERPVRTPSSEQVRQPVYRHGLEQWRNFEAHLGPLKSALGPLAG